MNFSELKAILKDIRRNFPCRDCGSIYGDQDLWIIGTLPDQGFFLGCCPNCRMELVISVMCKGHHITHRQIKRSQTFTPINSNDILDMRNFLKQFNGDFSSLFSKQ